MKRAISATIDDSLIRWIEKQLKDKRKYRNKSHLIEIALELMKEKEESRKETKRGKELNG